MTDHRAALLRAGESFGEGLDRALKEIAMAPNHQALGVERTNAVSAAQSEEVREEEGATAATEVNTCASFLACQKHLKIATPNTDQEHNLWVAAKYSLQFKSLPWKRFSGVILCKTMRKKMLWHVGVLFTGM